jgi:hypothetical protein
MAAFSSAPSMMAKPAENAYSRNAIGVASAPYVYPVPMIQVR